MLQELEYKDRYTPLAALPVDADPLALFESVRVTKHCTAQPDGASPELWLSVRGHFNGRSVYVRPCAALRKLMAACNVYGEPVYKDVYITVQPSAAWSWVVRMQYHQIVGSYALFTITPEQFEAIAAVYQRGINA